MSVAWDRKILNIFVHGGLWTIVGSIAGLVGGVYYILHQASIYTIEIWPLAFVPAVLGGLTGAGVVKYLPQLPIKFSRRSMLFSLVVSWIIASWGTVKIAEEYIKNVADSIPNYPQGTVEKISASVLGEEPGLFAAKTQVVSAPEEPRVIIDYYIAHLQKQGWEIIQSRDSSLQAHHGRNKLDTYVDTRTQGFGGGYYYGDEGVNLGNQSTSRQVINIYIRRN